MSDDNTPKDIEDPDSFDEYAHMLAVKRRHVHGMLRSVIEQAEWLDHHMGEISPNCYTELEKQLTRADFHLFEAVTAAVAEMP